MCLNEQVEKEKSTHIIIDLNILNRFCFAHAHCTHLQIAQADTQTKICKRVQFCQRSSILAELLFNKMVLNKNNQVIPESTANFL